MLIRRAVRFIQSNKQQLPPLITVILSIPLLVFARFFESPFGKLVSVATFLTWHNLLELSMSVAYISIFLVSIYSYHQTRQLRTILIGSMLLAAGILEACHMLSYKGMPSFFIENATSNRATTFWIVSKLIYALAFLIGSNIPSNIMSKVNGLYFSITALLISAVIFITATWYPAFLPTMYVEGQGLSDLKIILEYVVMLMLLVAAAVYFRNAIKYRDKMQIFMSCALILGMLSEFAFTVYVSVYDIYNYIGHMLGIISLFMAFRMNFARNVLAPYIALKAAQKELREYADNLDRTVEHRTSQLKMINIKLLEDLEYARGIQKSLLPVFLTDTREIWFNAVYLPTERISGDFYDVFRLDERHMGFYISDVSGHGVPAAMLTVFLKQCIDNIVEADRRKGTLSSPSAMLNQVYDAFNHSNFRDDVYIVMIYCIYDMVEKRLSCSSAGMNVMPVLMDAEGNIRDLYMRGFPICKLKGICTAEFPKLEFAVNHGDRLYLYTDGLTEARNRSGQSYTGERLKQFLADSRNKTTCEQASLLTDDLMDFFAGQKADDDVTLLAVEFSE